ncbi:hypothetical protein [Legionella sp. km772]|uniref:hypothetical protein n=1 Tax=Legionella sp. km772 TaxID=2498111 RepID=UPI000F8F07B4|nr:hypothetical protein [Legionella sp. km772]RUR12211.1 hypothetical protein ELY15_05795 [Legionella sp. km772]
MAEESNNSNKVFILGVICLVLSLGFLLFSLYILPFLLWDLAYDVPDMVTNMTSMLQDDYDYSSAGSKLIVWLVFFIPGLITGCISYYISNRLDKDSKL